MQAVLKLVIFLTLSMFFYIQSCKAQDFPKKEPMAVFDINTFDKHKDHLLEYEFFLKDSTFVHQRKRQFEYIETIQPKGAYFRTINRYYENGNLKSTVEDFPNDFLAGIMKEYDEQGNLIKETNYDAPYKFTWEEVLEWIKERNINMESDYLIIARGSDESGTSWDITWEKENKSSLRRAFIDGVTGKIIKEFDQEYPLDE
ncbi:hypothetical protein [Aquimarina muelleri]|uniref:MORN repeat variant n=1 Tax=Aquimarina muelleri TaxID=279356 RepID=A0A918JXQ2_9FLAO|nr:hypothetical protein [Aquimarina muelleri]MCX2764500.1 hypothetical protein [Aquimarina muelleri]GGX30776.1 hypothetical protein GCM10007384_34860 [Aquimarina muelleri]